MSVTIPNSFTGGTKARADEVNANFQAIAAKFTEGAGGIADADIAAAAAIKGSKLSGVPGNRITAAQMDDDAVDLRVLKDDITAGAPAAAVNTAAHIKDAIITNAKLVDATLTKGKMAFASVLIAIPLLGAGASSATTTGLVNTSAFVLTIHIEAPGVAGTIMLTLLLQTGTNTYFIGAMNHSGAPQPGFNVRVHYLPVP